MGTGYDCSDVKANTASPSITPEQRKWRTTLVAAMRKQGFVNYFRRSGGTFRCRARAPRPMISRSFRVAPDSRQAGTWRMAKARKSSNGFAQAPQAVRHVGSVDRAPAARSGNSGAPRCGASSSSPRCSPASLRCSAVSSCERLGRSTSTRPRRSAATGVNISLSVIMGLPAVAGACWIAIKPTRTPFADYLALRWTSWKNVAIGVVALFVLVACWDLLSRALGREIHAGLHGRRDEIGAGRRRAVAAGDRVLRRRADVGRVLRARLPLSRLVGVISAAGRRHRRCRRSPGPRCTCSTTCSSSARCFPSACCSAICATAPARPG